MASSSASNVLQHVVLIFGRCFVCLLFACFSFSFLLAWYDSCKCGSPHHITPHHITPHHTTSHPHIHITFTSHSHHITFTPHHIHITSFTLNLLDAEEKAVKFYHDCKLIKVHPAHTINAVHHAQHPDGRSPVDDEQNMFSVNIDFKLDNYLTRRTVYMGTAKEAEQLASLLTTISKGNFQQVNFMLRRPCIQSGFLQVRNPWNDNAWDEMWCECDVNVM